MGWMIEVKDGEHHKVVYTAKSMPPQTRNKIKIDQGKERTKTSSDVHGVAARALFALMAPVTQALMRVLHPVAQPVHRGQRR